MLHLFAFYIKQLFNYYYLNTILETLFSHSPFQAMAYLDDSYEHASNVHLAG